MPRHRSRRRAGVRLLLALTVALSLALGAQSAVGVPLGGPPVANAISLCAATVNCTTLQVTMSGLGSGTVTTVDGLINCSSVDGIATGTCAATFEWPKSSISYYGVVTYAPAVGSQFLHFGLVSVPVEEPFVLDPGEPYFVEAEFDPANYSLRVTTTGDGTGAVGSLTGGISCHSTCNASSSLPYGTSVVLNATPDSGAVFTAWTGACAGQGAVCSLTITANTTTNAVFGLPSASPGPSPSPSPSTGPTTAAGPTVSALQVLLATPGPVGTTTIPATVRWSGLPAGAPITAYDLQVSVNGGAWTEIGLASPLSTSASVALTVGHTAQFRVRAGDSAGHTGDWTVGVIRTPVAYQENASAVAYKGTWSTKTSSSDWAGHLREATSSSASASLHFVGWGVAFVTDETPTEGSVRLYLDGALAKTISLYASKTKLRQVVYTKTWSSSGSHTLKLVPVGTSGHPAVDLDGFAVLQ